MNIFTVKPFPTYEELMVALRALGKEGNSAFIGLSMLVIVRESIIQIPN